MAEKDRLCNGCGSFITKDRDLVMTSVGPMHKECADATN